MSATVTCVCHRLKPRQGGELRGGAGELQTWKAGGSQLERMSVPCDWVGEHLLLLLVGPELGEGAKIREAGIRQPGQG